jgi:hypothetical protein
MAAIHTAIRNVSQKIGTLSRDTSVFTDSGRVYNVIGIDQIHTALQPLLVEEGITIIPNVVSFSSWDVGEAPNRVHFAQAKVEFTLTGSDGSSVTGSSVGEGSSETDKAMPAAISIAEKSFLKQLFLLKTGDADPDVAGVGLSPVQKNSGERTQTRQPQSSAPQQTQRPVENKPQEATKMADTIAATAGPVNNDGVKMVSKPQSQMIWALTHKNDKTGWNDDKSFAYVSEIVCREVDDFSNLTASEAKKVIDKLKNLVGQN